MSDCSVDSLLHFVQEKIIRVKTEIKKTGFGDGHIAYRVKAAGGDAGIVFIHGLGADSRFFQKQLHYFASFITSVALDLPGSGASSRCHGGISMECLVEAVLAVIEAEKLKQVTLAGHSLGGAVAMELALRYPERVEAMVLISTGAHIPLSRALKEEMHRGAKEFFLFFIRSVFSRRGDYLASIAEKNIHLLDHELLRESFALCGSLDFRERLCEIRMPVLVVANSGDTLVPPEVSRLLAAEIPGAEFILFEAGGHVPFFEYAHLFDVEMEKFLRKCFPCCAASGAAKEKCLE